MSSTEIQQGGNNDNPPENDGPNAGTSSKKKKNNKWKQKKKNGGNASTNNGIKFKGNKTSGVLKGHVLSDLTRLLDQWKEFDEALIQQITVDDEQPEWGDAVRKKKKPKLAKLFKRKEMDPVNDGWGEIKDVLLRDKEGPMLTDENGAKITNLIIRTLDPVKERTLEARYKSYKKHMDKRENSHVGYKRIAVVMVVGQLGPAVKSKCQLNEAFKEAFKKKDLIDLLCAVQDTCYDASSIGSELFMVLNFKQKPKSELGPFAEKSGSQHKTVIKKLGDCHAGKTLMKIATKYPHYIIYDYNGVDYKVKLPNANQSTATQNIMVPVTNMTLEEKEECDKAYNKIFEARLLVLNNNKDYVQNYLNNAYINSKAEYPNTAASTLLQIMSIKPENNNEKVEAQVNIHAVDHNGSNDINEALNMESLSEVHQEEQNDENEESEPTIEDIIVAATASENEGVKDIDREELDFMEKEPERVEFVCGMVADDDKSLDYDPDISEEESTNYSSNDDSILGLIEREFADSSSDKEESTASEYYKQCQPIPHPVRPNTRDVVIQGRTLNRNCGTLTVSTDAEFCTNSIVANQNEAHH